MAFVARRSTEGKLVDCQVISSGSRSERRAVAISDQSDEDTDSGTVQGYSNRSYESPTVRYVATKDEEEEDLKMCYSYGGRENNNLNMEVDSVGEYCDRFKEQVEEEEEDLGIEDAQDAAASSDYLDMTSDEETVNCNVYDQELDEKTVLMTRRQYDTDEQECCSIDTMSLASLDVATVCSPHADVAKQPDDDLFSLSSCDVGTVCQQDEKDTLSMTSFDVETICNPIIEVKPKQQKHQKQPKQQQQQQPLDDTLSLGSISINSLMEPDNVSIQTDCQSHMTSRTFNVKSSTVRRDDCSSASTCSWTDMYGGALKQSESRSNIVPSLSLNISSNSSSGSSTYFRTLDEKKEVHGQAAYQEWVKRKERQKQQKQQVAKQEREKRDAETAMRQRMAKERYEEWCRQKETKQKKTPPPSTTTSSIKSFGNLSSSSSSGGGQIFGAKKPQTKLPPETTKKRLQEWERVKLQQQQRERELQRKKQQSKMELEQQRKQRSQGAWSNWMKSVGNRPKPVPLNQGIDTLRGTISNIYVNPVQWVSNIDPNDSRGN